MDSFQLSLFLAVPFFLVLMIIELVATKLAKRNYYDNKNDVISSLSSGIATAVIRTTGFGFAIISYDFMLAHLKVFNFVDITSPWAWFWGFIALDFGSYWGHRWKHKYNFLWQFHLVHHSSEEYNLPVALRQNSLGGINLLSFLLFPAAILGIPTDMLAILSIAFLYAQYWYHTRFFGELGILEYILVTPSQHRVHHAVNKEYIDKNFSAIFCIWDRLFGTFQRELPDQETIFGVKHPVKTLNPIKIDLMYWWDMVKTSVRTKQGRDKINVWLKTTGWRPEDIDKEYQKGNIQDIKKYQKYRPVISHAAGIWGIIEFIVMFIIAIGIVVQIPHLSFTLHVAGVTFVLFQIVTITNALEGKRNLLLPTLRLLIAGGLILYQGGAWFGIENYLPQISLFIMAYFSVGVVTAWTFYQTPMTNNDAEIDKVK